MQRPFRMALLALWLLLPACEVGTRTSDPVEPPTDAAFPATDTGGSDSGQPVDAARASHDAAAVLDGGSADDAALAAGPDAARLDAGPADAGPGTARRLTVARGGSGTVTSSPAGIDCGASCAATFPQGQVVTLSATAAAGYDFVGWSGAGCSGAGTCTVTLQADTTVTALFDPAPLGYTLAITKLGAGTVVASPAGIDCGRDCSEAYGAGATITLSATPASGFTFSRWLGGTCSGSGTCSVTLGRHTGITAVFTPVGQTAGRVWYLATTGADGSSCGTEASPCATFAHVLGRMAGGEALLVEDGVYSGQEIDRPPSGSADRFTLIRARNDGQVTVTNTSRGDVIGLDGHHIQIEGLRVVGNHPGGETGGLGIGAGAHHNKVLRTGFVTTVCTQCTNQANVAISGAHNLLEDCWAWGSGRYKFLVYGGDASPSDSGSYNVLRRCVARHDRQYSGGFNPHSTFCNYQGANNAFQNCIAIDSDQVAHYDHSWAGTFFFEKGQKGGTLHVVGSLSLNFALFWIRDNSSGSDADPAFRSGSILVSNSVAYDGNLGFVGWDTPKTNGRKLSIDHSLVGRLDGVADWQAQDTGSGFSGGWSNSPNATATNSLFVRIDNPTNGHALHQVNGPNDHNAFWANRVNHHQSTVGPHDVTNVDPFAASLRYPVRVEAGSPLKGAGAGGSDLGPTVLQRVGVSGTLYGEPGWDELTPEPLWPWPYEDRIKADMSAYPSNWPADGKPAAVRGFTAGTSRGGSPQTLTRYVWEYLGNTIPDEVYGGP